jgi:hypothetical protein
VGEREGEEKCEQLHFGRTVAPFAEMGFEGGNSPIFRYL